MAEVKERKPYIIKKENSGWFSKGTLRITSANTKGHVPWNKGTKGVMKSNSGSFKRIADEERKIRREYSRKKAWLKSRYKMTPEEYDSLFLVQHNQCAICGKEFIEIPDIDHSHRTGKVRGLLCNPCNLLLGGARDSIEILEKAIIYLKEREYNE